MPRSTASRGGWALGNYDMASRHFARTLVCQLPLLRVAVALKQRGSRARRTCPALDHQHVAC